MPATGRFVTAGDPICAIRASGTVGFGLVHALDEDVLVRGDSNEGMCAAFTALLQQINSLRGVNCGHLERARITEPMLLLT